MYPRPHVGVTAIEFGSRSPYYGAPQQYATPVRTTEVEGLPLLVRGSTGRWVTYVQTRLGIAPTGVYDWRTEAAVRTVQVQAGLAPTGRTDLATWQAIAYGAAHLNWAASPYGSFDPYGGSYGGAGLYGYPFIYGWGPRGSAGHVTSSGGGGRSGMGGGGQ